MNYKGLLTENLYVCPEPRTYFAQNRGQNRFFFVRVLRYTTRHTALRPINGVDGLPLGPIPSPRFASVRGHGSEKEGESLIN